MHTSTDMAGDSQPVISSQNSYGATEEEKVLNFRFTSSFVSTNYLHGYLCMCMGVFTHNTSRPTFSRGLQGMQLIRGP